MNQMFALMCPQRGLWTGGVNIRRPSAATALGSTKTFHFLIPTTAGEVGMNTWCGGYRTTTWQGYYYGITPGTSTVNASGYVNEYLYTQPYSGYQFWYTYCVLTSITYS